MPQHQDAIRAEGHRADHLLQPERQSLWLFRWALHRLDPDLLDDVVHQVLVVEKAQREVAYPLAVVEEVLDRELIHVLPHERRSKSLTQFSKECCGRGPDSGVPIL